MPPPTKRNKFISELSGPLPKRTKNQESFQNQGVWRNQPGQQSYSQRPPVSMTFLSNKEQFRAHQENRCFRCFQQTGPFDWDYQNPPRRAPPFQQNLTARPIPSVQSNQVPPRGNVRGRSERHL